MTTVIFDIGNVLLKFDPRGFLKEQYEKEDVDLILSELFLTEQWHGLDRNDFTDQEMLEGIYKRYPEKKELFKSVYEDWTSMLTPIEATVQIAKELKEKGYTLLLLSNFSQRGYKKVWETYPWFKYFDGGVISFEVNACKPEEIIYEQLIFQYGLDPKECLFIDDLAKNIDAAKALGIQGIWFTKGIDLRDVLLKKQVL